MTTTQPWQWRETVTYPNTCWNCQHQHRLDHTTRTYTCNVIDTLAPFDADDFWCSCWKARP